MVGLVGQLIAGAECSSQLRWNSTEYERSPQRCLFFTCANARCFRSRTAGSCPTNREHDPEKWTGFPKRSCSIKNPARDRDSTQSDRALAASSFYFGRALRRGSTFALRRWLRFADRLGQDRLGLRVADRLGQHRVKLGLCRRGRFCHFVAVSFDFAASLASRSAFKRS